MEHVPAFVSWSAAPGHILARAHQALLSPHAFVVGITGPVGAGKSTLAEAISPCIISTDHYLPDYEAIPEHERDLPEHADVQRLEEDVASLKSRRPTAIPRWSFQSHRREGEISIPPHDIVVVEGIHALHDHLVPLLDLRVYVEAPREVRWRRWELLESRGERGWGVEKARSYFDRVAELTFARFAPQYRQRAHVVVLNDASPDEVGCPVHAG